MYMLSFYICTIWGKKNHESLFTVSVNWMFILICFCLFVISFFNLFRNEQRKTGVLWTLVVQSNCQIHLYRETVSYFALFGICNETRKRRFFDISGDSADDPHITFDLVKSLAGILTGLMKVYPIPLYYSSSPINFVKSNRQKILLPYIGISICNNRVKIRWSS